MIKNIYVEIRPTLKCCHFFVAFKEGTNSEVKMKVRKSSLVFVFKGNTFNVNLKDFTIEPLTLRDFKSTNKGLSFRIQAECFLKLQKYSQPKLFPPVLQNEKLNILCECENPLTSKVVFERVLPLPSEDFSFSDLFCHLPAGVQNPSTTPKPNDCFYSDIFLQINEINLVGCKKKEKFLKCNRCLSTVGLCNKNSAKLYISCLKLPHYNLTLLEHFKSLIKKAISNPVTIFPKILLECEENETYLSLMVVDKNLVISNCDESLILKNNEVVKLKYKFYSSCDADVKLLKEDSFLQHTQVHKTLLDYCTKFLISNTQTIPPIFSKMENECMAYLSL